MEEGQGVFCFVLDGQMNEPREGAGDQAHVQRGRLSKTVNHAGLMWKKRPCENCLIERESHSRTSLSLLEGLHANQLLVCVCVSVYVLMVTHQPLSSDLSDFPTGAFAYQKGNLYCHAFHFALIMIYIHAQV